MKQTILAALMVLGLSLTTAAFAAAAEAHTRCSAESERGHQQLTSAPSRWRRR